MAPSPKTQLDTDLYKACLEGDRAQALALFGRGADPLCFQTRFDNDALGVCALKGHWGLLRDFCKDAYLESSDVSLARALTFALTHPNPIGAKVLLAHGARWESCEWAKLPHPQAVEKLASQRALRPGAPAAFSRPWREGSTTPFEGPLEELFQRACAQGPWEPDLWALARACLRAGARLEGAGAQRAAYDLARSHPQPPPEAQEIAMVLLAKGFEPDGDAKLAWVQAFPSLMLSLREREALSEAPLGLGKSHPRPGL